MKIDYIYSEIRKGSDPVFLFSRDSGFLFDVLDDLHLMALQKGDTDIRVHKRGAEIYHVSPNDLVDYARFSLQKGSNWRVEVFATISPYLLEAAQRFYVDEYKPYKRELRTKLVFRDYYLEDISLSKIYDTFAEPFELFREMDAEYFRKELVDDLKKEGW